MDDVIQKAVITNTIVSEPTQLVASDAGLEMDILDHFCLGSLKGRYIY